MQHTYLALLLLSYSAAMPALQCSTCSLSVYHTLQCFPGATRLSHARAPWNRSVCLQHVQLCSLSPRVSWCCAVAANPGALLPVVNGFTHAPHDGQQLQPPSAELFPLERPGGSDREVLVTIYTPSERHAAIAIEPVGRTAGGQVMYEAGVRSNNTGHSVGELLQDPTSSVFVGYRGDAAPGVDSIREDPTGRLQSDQQIELGRWRGLYSSPDPDTAAAYALGEDGRTLGAVSQVVLHPDIQRFAAELPNDHPLVSAYYSIQ